jgi:hypothetical protein
MNTAFPCSTFMCLSLITSKEVVIVTETVTTSTVIEKPLGQGYFSLCVNVISEVSSVSFPFLLLASVITSLLVLRH